MVYVLLAEGTGMLKIGHTIGKPHANGDTGRNRFQDIRTGCPVPLSCIAAIPGGSKVEADIHQRFDVYRKGGAEWFKNNGPVATWVQSIEGKHPALVHATNRLLSSNGRTRELILDLERQIAIAWGDTPPHSPQGELFT